MQVGITSQAATTEGVKLIEQAFNRPRFGEGFAGEPQRLGVGNGVLQF